MRTQLHLHRLRVLANHLNSVKVNTEYSNVTSMKFGRDNLMFFYENRPFIILPFLEMELEHLFPHHF